MAAFDSIQSTVPSIAPSVPDPVDIGAYGGQLINDAVKHDFPNGIGKVTPVGSADTVIAKLVGNIIAGDQGFTMLKGSPGIRCRATSITLTSGVCIVHFLNPIGALGSGSL